MSLRTMGHLELGVSLAGYAVAHVVGRCPSSQVERIDALWVVAVVENKQALRDRAVESLKCPAVG